MKMDKNLNLIAPVGSTGYGVVGFNTLRTLVERDWEVSLFPRGNCDRTEHDKQLAHFAQSNSSYFPYDAACLNIWHQFDLSTRIGRGKYVAWPIFELDTFDEKERHNLNYPDELIVCSEWAEMICRNNEVTVPIHVVPLGVDPSIFNIRRVPTEKSNNTVFLNAGKWEIRKGHDFLSDAFNAAFNPEDNVELWLLPFNPFLTQGDAGLWEKMYLETPMGQAGKVKIFDWQKDQDQVAQVMSEATCGVFPSRGEGWNLEVLEMMALGKPVIVTNYSAHTEFCDEYNSMLIDIDEVEPAYDGKWFFEQGDWAEFGESQMKQLIQHLRLTHKRHQGPGRFINDAGIETAQKLSWDYVGDLLEKILLDTE
jgi:glycosyltransferase involved in cell wall biosynthesis